MNIRSRSILWLVAAWALGSMGCAQEGGREEPTLWEGAGEAPRTAAALPEGAQAVSFLGDALFPPSLDEEVLARRAQQLEEALLQLAADPQGADALIWAGRRHAYLGDYRKAIEVFTEGIQYHPDDPRFYRHRGHRYISVREMDMAIADFRRASELIQGTADEVEPDGQPNALGVPTSTLHFNIFYHYALAHFIKGDFEEAGVIYRRCMDASAHPDSKVATAHWWYMSLRRSGRDGEATELLQGMDLDALAPEVIESGAYLELLRLYSRAEENPEQDLSQIGSETVEEAARGYGVGSFLLYNGHGEEATEVFRRVVAARDQWAAFGYIAAEADLARLEGPEGL